MLLLHVARRVVAQGRSCPARVSDPLGGGAVFAASWSAIYRASRYPVRYRSSKPSKRAPSVPHGRSTPSSRPPPSAAKSSGSWHAYDQAAAAPAAADVRLDPGRPLPASYKAPLLRWVAGLTTKHYRQRCASLGIAEADFDVYAPLFIRFVQAMAEGDVRGTALARRAAARHSPSAAYEVPEGWLAQVAIRVKTGMDPDLLLLPQLFHFVLAYAPEPATRHLRELMAITDLRAPARAYPRARALQRRVILHVGPTNSGKTYNALQDFEAAASAAYLAPLRLLAHEVFQRLQGKGIPCNMITGEQRHVSHNVRRTAMTIEMAQLEQDVDVAVVDEIQMLANDQRGWAWSAAILGLPAKTLHLCGEATAVPLIRRMLRDTGDTIEVREYERLTSLAIEPILPHLSHLQRGDAVIAFSRRRIFELKSQIENATALRCAVVYGSLPPETRSLQAQHFNDTGHPIDVLVASDAVGMGLNLNIRRVVFDTTSKFNGQYQEELSLSQMKQIAGRAGRYGTEWEHGTVTAFHKTDHAKLARALKQIPPPLTHAGIQPTLDQLVVLAQHLPDDTLSTLLLKFAHLATIDGVYMLCNIQALIDVCALTEEYELGIADRWQLTMCPVKTRVAPLAEAFRRGAAAVAEGRPLRLQAMLDHLPRRHTQPFFDDLDAALGGASHRDEANPADEVAAWLDCAVVDTVGDTDGELDGELDGQAPRVIDAPLSASKNQGTAPPVIEPMTEVPATSTPPRKDDIATMMEALTASVQNSASDVSGLSKPQIQGLLQGYEHLHSAILMYMWLSFRFPATFVDALSAELIKERVEQAIVALLSIQTPRKKKVLPLRSTPSNHAAFRSYRS